MKIKYTLLAVIAICANLILSAQLNVSYVGEITYNQDLSDIWGYVAPNGDEYAVVGVRNGVSIVDLTDPSNPTELFFFPGANSTWRDIKTFAGHAYVTNESGNGLAVIDLTELPGNATAFDWTPDIPGEGVLNTIHNIYIDEFGYAYLAGSNLNNGGMLYIDVFSDPGNPIYVDKGPGIYSHDVFTRDNIMYSSEIYEGIFSIYDVSNKNNTQLLGSNPTEAAFTHNAWLSDDSNTLYTTDEVADAPIGAYDVSDPSDVQELDQFRPFETLGEGVIPHNVHVFNDWLIVSYYTDGCIILDGSNPTNLVEVGNFDTFLPDNVGFSGAWGAYPFLPSGLILISDIGNGMYVLEPNYVNACWLEGQITDASNGVGITGADIAIQTTIITEESGAGGNYATGYAIPGEYDILVEMPGYISQTITVMLENGVITPLDVELVPLTAIQVAGSVSNGLTAVGIAEAQILVIGNGIEVMGSTDANGAFSLNGLFPGTYNVTVGQWGFQTQCGEVIVEQGGSDLSFELLPGYMDDFSLDFTWTETSNADTGDWERVVPDGTNLGGQASNPGTDVDGDCGNMAFVTGNGGGQAGNDDVDAGDVILFSPTVLTQNASASVSFDWWYANYDDTIANDEFVISVTDGNTTVVLATIDDSVDMGTWNSSTFDVSAVLPNAATLQFIFSTSDDVANGSIVEAAIDNFRVDLSTGISELIASNDWTVSPNPFNELLSLSFHGTETMVGAQVLLKDALGRTIATERVNSDTDTYSFGADVEAGLYFIQIQKENKLSGMKQVLKY